MFYDHFHLSCIVALSSTLIEVMIYNSSVLSVSFFHTKPAQTSVNMNFYVSYEVTKVAEIQKLGTSLSYDFAYFHFFLFFLVYTCSIILFPVIHHICFSVKWFLHILFPPSHIFLSWLFPLHKRRLKFLITMPTSHFFLPRRAEAKSAAHLSALLWYKQEETKASAPESFSCCNPILWPLMVVHLLVIQCSFGCPSKLYFPLMSW